MNPQLRQQSTEHARQRRSRRPYAQGQRAFTLIELMIVIGLLGILASLALPSYFKYVARGKAAELLVDIDEFRTKLATAKATGGLEPNCDWRLAIDPARLGYRYADLSISASGSAINLIVWSISARHGKMGTAVAREAFHVLDRAGLVVSKPGFHPSWSVYVVELQRPVDCSASPDSQPPARPQATGAGQSSPSAGAGATPGAAGSGSGPATQPSATVRPPGQAGNPAAQGQSVGGSSSGSQGSTGRPPGQTGNPGNSGHPGGSQHPGGGGNHK